MAALSLPTIRLPTALIPWLGKLTALAMLAVLAWLGTNIFWTLTTKVMLPPAMTLETDPQRAAQATMSRHILGEVASSEATAAAAMDIRLTGVIAAQHPGKAAMAFLSVDGKPATAVHEGEDVAPGITLNRVLPRQVELLRGGRPITVTLPQRSKPDGKPVEVARESEEDAASGGSRKRILPVQGDPPRGGRRSP